MDLDPEDLEQIALIYDNIRQLRRSASAMRGNSDRDMASDFDSHLKRTMSQLSNDIKRTNSHQNLHLKNTHVIRAKKELMQILVHKLQEYFD